MRTLLLIVLAILPSQLSIATVTIIADSALWQSTAQDFTSLTFTEYPQFTLITDQYADQGIHFTDGNDFIRTTASYSDGHGLMSIDAGGVGTIHASFDAPTYSLAIEFLGGMQFELYSGGELAFESIAYSAGFTPFVGLISTTPFDAVVLHDYDDDIVSVDNLYFGPPIPAPSVFAMFCLGFAYRRRRR